MERCSRIVLEPREAAAIDEIMEYVASGCYSVEDESFLRNVRALGNDLPVRLRDHVRGFLDDPEMRVCRISGYVLTQEVGPTPKHWSDVRNPDSRFDFYFMVLASLLGDVFGFSDLQDGKLVQEIFPIRADAEKQLGTGSVHLTMHTEDTALEYRAEHLGFACVRNPDRIALDVSIPEFDRLSPSTAATLRRDVYVIINDRPTLTPEQRKEARCTTSVLHGAGAATTMRYDPLYSDLTANGPAEVAALRELEALVEASVVPVCLEPGEVVFVDNRRCAHGRRGYAPRYDGTDRWLKRAQISRGLDRFSHLKLTGHRNIFP